MTGGIMAGASMTAGSLLQHSNSLITIGKTANPNYGRVDIGYGNPSVNGSTFLNIAKGSGKPFFRLDFDPTHMLHAHFGATKSALALHRTGLVNGVAGFVSGVFSHGKNGGKSSCE